MQEYDATLKLLLQGSAKGAVRALVGTDVRKWLNVELPKVQNLRMDLLGETSEGGLVHVELQGSNDPDMPLRMAEYCLNAYRLLGKFPRQVLLYVGEAPMRMASELRGGDDLWFRYRAVDFRQLDGEALLASNEVGDNVIAILAKLRDQRMAIRQMLGRIGGLSELQRGAAFDQLLILAGLRRLGTIVEEEARKMPIMGDLRDHEVIGREYRKGVEEGRQEGRVEGELAILRRQIEKKFGPLSEADAQRLAKRPIAQLEELGLRLLEVHSLDELLK